jgi:hypothetical protein
LDLPPVVQLRIFEVFNTGLEKEVKYEYVMVARFLLWQQTHLIFPE